MHLAVYRKVVLLLDGLPLRGESGLENDRQATSIVCIPPLSFPKQTFTMVVPPTPNDDKKRFLLVCTALLLTFTTGDVPGPPSILRGLHTVGAKSKGGEKQAKASVVSCRTHRHPRALLVAHESNGGWCEAECLHVVKHVCVCLFVREKQPVSQPADCLLQLQCRDEPFFVFSVFYSKISCGGARESCSIMSFTYLSNLLINLRPSMATRLAYPPFPIVAAWTNYPKIR